MEDNEQEYRREKNEEEIKVSLRACMGLRTGRARLPGGDKNELVKKVFQICFQLSEFLTSQASQASALDEQPSSDSSADAENAQEPIVQFNKATMEASWVSEELDTSDDILTPFYKIAKVEVTEGSPMPVLDALLIIRRRSKDTDFEDLLVSQFCQILETVKASPEIAVHLE